MLTDTSLKAAKTKLEDIPELILDHKNYRRSSIGVKVRDKSERQKKQEIEMNENKNGRGSQLSKVFLEDYADY